MNQRLEDFITRTADIWATSTDEARALLATPRRKSLRLNALKARKGTPADLEKAGVQLSALSWAQDCYKVTGGYELLTRNPLFEKAEFILQDAASFIPVLALEPKPTERILDVCAAPGGKTSHIAAISKNKAHITANDTSKSRFFRMRDLLAAQGVFATCTLTDGRHLAKSSSQPFDKILLDAPCSGEAAIDPNNPKTYEQWSTAKIKRLSRLQQQLLLSAFDNLTVGGTLVYSTCTIAPEENELVVAHLLKRRSAVLAPISHKPNDARSGLTLWRGKQLDPQLQHAVRLLPSETHEAFFVAKIIKQADDSDSDKVYF